MSHLLISAARKSSGKTIVTTGLCAAYKSRGLTVQPFKKGPDYIDPMWLSEAAGRSCYNLDFHTMSVDEITSTFQQHSSVADISLIEGNKGLYDGLDLDGSNSNAALATLLGAPVVLVIDAVGMTRGIAPLILGYQDFEPKINIAGVVLSQLGGSRHESKLRAVIEHYTDVPVLGGVHKSSALEMQERHLGLVPSNEVNERNNRILEINKGISSQLDLDRILEIATTAKVVTAPTSKAIIKKQEARIKIAYAQDSAFGFYYASDKNAFVDAGVELVPINTLSDPCLPDVDGLFIGGGFPETQMQTLEQNKNLRKHIAQAINAGMPVYAECGGLMYLSRSLSWQGERAEMVGAIPADSIMHDKPMGRGYVHLKETGLSHWPKRDNLKENDNKEIINAHEFHHSSLENIGEDVEYAYEVLRGTGITGTHDGILYKNVLASYSHLQDTNRHHWVKRFVQFVTSCQWQRNVVTDKNKEEQKNRVHYN